MIYFRYLECKSSYTIYYIDFTLQFAVNKMFKKELVFHCRTLNDIFDSDDNGSVKSQ